MLAVRTRSRSLRAHGCVGAAPSGTSLRCFGYGLRSRTAPSLSREQPGSTPTEIACTRARPKTRAYASGCGSLSASGKRIELAGRRRSAYRWSSSGRTERCLPQYRFYPRRGASSVLRVLEESRPRQPHPGYQNLGIVRQKMLARSDVFHPLAWAVSRVAGIASLRDSPSY
jgi:hypothetical protein